MTLGSSIILIAVGAILRYAVTFHVSGVSRPTIGLILMVAGAAGVVLTLIYMASGRPRGAAVRDRYGEPL